MVEEKDVLVPVRDGARMALLIYRRPGKIGADTIYHDAEHPSELVLPILNIE